MRYYLKCYALQNAIGVFELSQPCEAIRGAVTAVRLFVEPYCLAV